MAAIFWEIAAAIEPPFRVGWRANWGLHVRRLRVSDSRSAIHHARKGRIYHGHLRRAGTSAARSVRTPPHHRLDLGRRKIRRWRDFISSPCRRKASAR